MDFAAKSIDEVLGKPIIYLGVDRLRDQDINLRPITKFFVAKMRGEIL